MAKRKKRAPKITDEKREKMFEAFCEKPNFHYVSQKCRVARPTVAKYHDIDDWPQRLERIRERARRKADTDLVAMRARHMGIGKLYQQRAAEYLSQNKLATESGAILAGQIGIRVEREAAGEPGETAQQEIIVRYVDGSGNSIQPAEAEPDD